MNIDDTAIAALGPRCFPSPLAGRGNPRFVDDGERVALRQETSTLEAEWKRAGRLAGFELAGPRQSLFFDPARVRCAIVTCGGLCPGLNNVIRSLVYTLGFSYGVTGIVGIRYGYKGLARKPRAEPVDLDGRVVEDIHKSGGTFLGSCRGTPPVPEVVDSLEKRQIDLLFAIGGDGTLRGVAEVCEEIRCRDLAKAVIGIPKTIDNDLHWVERSFGFTTAVEEAVRAIDAAHQEARGAWNGVGLVKLMGRHSGFIAIHASVASGDVNFCLIPEVAFSLEGESGLLAALERRLEQKRHAVIVVAEGAGQDMVSRAGQPEKRDASGNLKLGDIGVALRDAIAAHFERRGVEMSIKYIDPSYIIRSRAACAVDAELCAALAQNAAHAGMAGKTGLFIGIHASRFVHVPAALGIVTRKTVDPLGEEWRTVREALRQPVSLG